MDHLLAIYQDYATAIQLTLGLVPWERVHRMLQLLHQARIQQQTVFVMGSGISSTAASHMAYELDTLAAGEMSAYPPLRVMALIDAAPSFLIWGDTRSYDSTFARLLNRIHAGDIVIAISTHGTAPDILNALQRTRALGGITIGLGSDQDRKLAEAVDLPVLVPNDSIDQLEDVCQIVAHIVAKALRHYPEPRHSDPRRKWRIATNGASTPYRLPLIFIEPPRRAPR